MSTINPTSPLRLRNTTTVHFEDGTTALLSDYPREFVEHLEALALDPIEELGASERRPEECPSTMVEYYQKSVVFVNGKLVLGRLLGIAYEMTLGAEPFGGIYSAGYANEDLEDDEDVRNRLSWVTHEAKGGHTVWWYRRDTGDGILLDDYAYMIAFHDEADDAAFLAAFPGAGA